MDSQKFDITVTLASVTATAAGSVTGSAVLGLPANPRHGIQLVLVATSNATAEDDLLDVWVQTRVGADWYYVCEFPQVEGDAAAGTTYLYRLTKNVNLATLSQVVKIAASDALAETGGMIRCMFGDAWRVRYTVTEGVAEGHDPAFTFTVYAREY